VWNSSRIGFEFLGGMLSLCYNHKPLWFILNFPGIAKMRAAIYAMLILAWGASFAEAQEDNTAQAKRGPKMYMGRPIAQTMHYTGAEWLLRDEREREERCSLMISNLGIKGGQRVCDMGCGNGFYTLQLAKMVGKKGHVYAVDIQPEMLKMLNDRADKAEISNITPILGTQKDPRLPLAELDLILMVDVYHEFSYPAEMLVEMKEALAPGGQLVFVEYRAEDPKVPIRPEHKMARDQVIKELTAAGFQLSNEFEKLPWQHMLWFSANDSPTK
jgi:ubiquinone/menaquinone biosynthesis C-methylase UbiE